MAKRYRLIRSVTHIHNVRVDSGKQARCQVSGRQRTATQQHQRESVNPIWEMKLLHLQFQLKVVRKKTIIYGKFANQRSANRNALKLRENRGRLYIYPAKPVSS